jgi:hypothetical protein
LRLCLGFASAAAILLGWAEARAECVTETLLTAGPPVAEYRLRNSCDGLAVVHWTRRSDNKIEQGAWDVGACSARDHQDAVGQYTFGEVEFRQGGGDRKCLDAAKRETEAAPDGTGSGPAPGPTKWGCAARGPNGAWGDGGDEPTKESAIHNVLAACGVNCRIIECRPNVNSDSEAMAIWPPPGPATRWCGPQYGTKC